jgi:hypothetical protein
MLQDDYEVKPKGNLKQNGNQQRGLIEEITDLKLSLTEETRREEEEGEGDASPDETIGTVMALLGSIMELGSFKRDEREEKLLRNLILPALQSIASRDTDSALGEMASDVALMIMVRGEKGKRKRQGEEIEPISQIKGLLVHLLSHKTPLHSFVGTSDLSQLLREVEIDLHDSEPPIRAYGIKRILSFLRSSEQVLSPPYIGSPILTTLLLEIITC